MSFLLNKHDNSRRREPLFHAPCHVTSCCCGFFNVERGSFLLGILGVILSVILFIISAVGLALTTDQEHFLCSIFFTLSIFCSAHYSLLIIGVWKRNEKVILAYLILEATLNALAVMGGVYAQVKRGGSDVEQLFPVGKVTSGVTYWVVVFSFYRDLKGEGGEGMRIAEEME